MEHHYAASNQFGNALARRVHGEEEAGKEPNLVALDEDVGLVGATICFTPEPSPRSSPNLEGVREDLSIICSLSVSNNYIGSLNAHTTGGSSVEGAASKMSSSAMHIASSLDGRSTTEYEILDGVSSRGTMDIEDLSLDEESLSITLHGLNCGGDHDDNFGLPTADKTESPPMMFKTLSVEEHPGETLILDDITAGRDVDSPVTSPIVDEHALTPFNNILKFWEGKSTYTSMARRTIGTETTQGVNTDESSTERCTHPSDSHANETRSSGQQSLDLTKTRTSMLFAKVKQALMYIAASILSFIASASTLFVIFLCGFIAYVLGIVNRTLGHVRLRNMTRGTIAQNIIEAGPPQDEVNRPAMSAEDPPGLTRTNLSKLFFLDALEKERIVGTLAESVRQFESEELEQSSVGNKVAALDQQEKAILKTINDIVTAGIVSKCKRVISSIKFAASRFAIISSSSFICMLMCIHFSSCVHMFRKSTDVESIEEDNLHCVSTKMSSYVSVTLWELILSPNFFEEGSVVYNEAPGEVRPRFWPSTMVIVSITTALLCALIFTSKIPFPSTKRKGLDYVLIGIWSEEEHRQFLEGYNVHGSRWKLVSAFVPTRTHAQVRTHGSYWLKIHSPKKMTKTRKQDHISGCPSSVSSSKSTPRKSNPIMTPNGILCEKDQNRLHKHVTPRSEGKITKVRKTQGSKSHPAKRVEVDAC
jgi:hypothetical protein